MQDTVNPVRRAERKRVGERKNFKQ
jgi:hypothetical protein